MKTELKDVFHLYLGCNFIYSGTKDVSENELTAINYDIIDNDDDWKEVKPILRPLSDWGLAEQEEYKLIFKNHVPTLGGDQNLAAKQTLHLLKQGFDLFGLIESGQAINKTKLLNL